MKGPSVVHMHDLESLKIIRHLFPFRYVSGLTFSYRLVIPSSVIRLARWFQRLVRHRGRNITRSQRTFGSEILILDFLTLILARRPRDNMIRLDNDNTVSRSNATFAQRNAAGLTRLRRLIHSRLIWLKSDSFYGASFIGEVSRSREFARSFDYRSVLALSHSVLCCGCSEGDSSIVEMPMSFSSNRTRNKTPSLFPLCIRLFPVLSHEMAKSKAKMWKIRRIENRAFSK